MKRPLNALLMAAILVLGARDVRAHAVGLSSIEVVLSGVGVEAQIGLAPQEVARAFPELDVDESATIEEGELTVPGAAEALRGGLELVVDGAPCELNLKRAALAPGDATLFDYVGRCPTGRLEKVRVPWLGAVGPKHRAFVRVTDRALSREGADVTGAPVGEALLTLERPEASLDVLVEGRSSFTFLPLGIEHILIGADHLLFLFGVVLVRARRRDLLAIVTAFTLAHSITLGAAVLGWFSLSSTLVEAVIALSVAFVGVENLLGPDMKKRWRVTFLFGLVHGFGFAGVLAEIGLPEDATVPALLLFNVGVEVGQLLVLAFVLPMLGLLRRREGYDKKAVPVMSVVVVLVGLVWFAERVGLF